MRKIAFLLIQLLTFISCKNRNSQGSTLPQKHTPVINYALVKTMPHDTNSFTEGLVIYRGRLFESTGAPEELSQTYSLFGVVDSLTGKIEVKSKLDRKIYFGEGIAFLNNKIYQLTYKNNKGFIYDSNNFQKIREFSFPNKEGWGLTTDGTYLIMSDGTNKLSFYSPDSFLLRKTLEVSDFNGDVNNLNELEVIGGFIYANVFTTNKIVKIDPLTGSVVGEIDLTSLANEAKNSYNGSMEMNGIAYDSVSKTVFVTGKMWPTIYEITFNH